MTSRSYSSLPEDEADARARLAGAYRRLGHAIAGHHLPVETADDATDRVEALIDAISHTPRSEMRSVRPSGEWTTTPADGEAMYTFDERPVSGRSAPISLDLDVTRQGDEAVAHLTLDKAHEGAPERSHGGFVSMLFDDLFGFVLAIEQQPGFTGQLGIRFEAATPIGEPLECRVRLDDRDGRKLHMSGELTVLSSGQVTARGTATFIAVDLSAFRDESA